MIGARGAGAGKLVDVEDARAGDLVDVEDKGVRVDGGEGAGAHERGTTEGRIPRGLGTMEEGLGLLGRLPGTWRGESWCETMWDGPGLGGLGVLACETCETRDSIC